MSSLFLFYISSGLFLGWSLGASDASNIFGTAIATRMIRFKTAATIASFFIIIGAVHAGSGGAATLGELGSINTLAGAFMASLAAAIAICWSVKISMPVSTSQAIVGAIIGWNFYAGKPTDYTILSKIISTWIFCPILAGITAIILYKIIQYHYKKSNIHLIRRDQYTRTGLIIAGAFGAYALGANNIANVMGVFVPASPLKELTLPIINITLNKSQVLFFLGAIAISLGIFTYSQKVIKTIGNNIMKMSPLMAFVVVISQALVLFLFSSQELFNILQSHNLPTIPLVPVSSTQAVVGAVIGIGIAKGGNEINWKILSKIVLSWIFAPILSALICYISLFFLQNVFNMVVYK